MKIQTGNPARGNDFFNRKNLIQKAWDLIESGNHILIAAPRRVGKTSLMYFLLDHPKNNYIFLYLITESVNNENEFFRRVVNKVLKTDFIQASQKVMAFLEKIVPTIKKVGPSGVEFGVNEEHNYREMLGKILASPSEGKKLIIMLDEFPETLENIIEDEGASAGRHFLQSNRELRQQTEISDQVQFIYTGSIGLENVVSQLNAVNTINDLARLQIPPLKKEQAEEMMNLLLKNVDFELSEHLIKYILEKIEWLIPFYLQSVMQELKDLCRDEHITQITEAVVDQAFTNMLEQRQYFEHWHTRLRTSFKGKDYSFVKNLLNVASENGFISSNEIYDLAVKYEKEETFKDFVGSLIYDGYINNHGNPAKYRYNSPILRMWWRQNVAN
ncbi:MAG: ATP-binding protein [Calditrichaeota bacterium]|nr:ATP-binding protein [Calditrichota bacterium]